MPGSSTTPDAASRSPRTEVFLSHATNETEHVGLVSEQIKALESRFLWQSMTRSRGHSLLRRCEMLSTAVEPSWCR